MRDRMRSERGFTLIELMVVVLVLSILLTIGVPTLMGARRRAQDRAAQALTRLALSAQLVHYTPASGFSGDNSVNGELDSIEPDVAWGTLAASDKGVIASVAGPGNDTTILRSQSSGGTTFCIGRVAEGSTAGTYFTTGCAGTETKATVEAWPSTTETGW